MAFHQYEFLCDTSGDLFVKKSFHNGGMQNHFWLLCFNVRNPLKFVNH